jgi:ABC-type branched-subunit amino acid transport system ATPase component/predicted MFS family arabinose efflux permease
VPSAESDHGGPATAGLVQAVLDAEAERRAERAMAAQEVVFADDVLPGVGEPAITLREGVLRGGVFTVVLLALLQGFGELENATLSVLAPNIRDTFHVSDGVIVFITAASGAFLALGLLPMGWLADRGRRAPIIGWATAAFSVMVFACGVAANAFVLFVARLGAGVAKSNTYPVQGSLVADTYPIAVRGRVNATVAGGARLAAVLSPAIVGGIAALAGGRDGWRWAYLVLALPTIPLAIFAFRMPDAPRGRPEMLAVLGEEVGDTASIPIPLTAALERCNRIHTFKTMLLGFAALGFGVITGPVLQNLYLDRHFHLGTFGRGVVMTVTGFGALVVLPFVAKRYDAEYRRDPAAVLRMIGLLIMPVAVILPVQYFMPNATLFAIVGILPGALLLSAVVMVVPIIQSVVPHRLRGLGIALGSTYVFLAGATLAAILAAFFTDAFGPRGAMLAVGIPSTFLGGLLIRRGASSIKRDLSAVVSELRSELDEQRRQDVEPENVPAIQVSSIDFAYGHVQVLFDVGFEVRRGEVLALLGTNGAGKSTILRLIAGLGTPSRGVVRLHGTPITYVAPEQRVKHGIRLLPGGKGVFPYMTIRENLEMGAYIYRADSADRDRRIARVLDMFGVLADRQNEMAVALSGGQQQMLALAITLLHDPDVLLIDELSLGLAPIVVEQLLAVVERLKREGLTIVIVEQSLNVALSIADRAVFLEKGRVRFEGSARELAERDDLARAVFLGREGG